MTRRTRWIGILASAALAAMVLAACGSGSAPSSTGGAGEATGTTGATGATTSSAPVEGTAVDVALGETDVQHMYMNLSSTDVPAGTVTFRITNEGVKKHEFVILATDTAAADLELNGDEVDEEAYTVVDEAEDIEPGASVTLTVSLDPGHYALICNLEGHFRMGMFNDLTAS